MPPAFRPFYPDLAQADLLVKIPIDVDRRDTRPGRPLYRTVMGLNHQTLTLLTLGEGGVEKHDFPLEEIQAIRSFHVLLRGQISLFLKEGSIITLGYNTVSRPLVEKLVDQILAALPAGSSSNSAPSPSTPEIADYHYRSLLKDHKKRRSAVQTVYYEAPGTRGFTPQGKRRRSLGLLILDSGRELLLLDRGAAPAQSLEALYGGDCTFVPRERIRGLEILPLLRKGKPAGEELRIRLEGHTLGFRLLAPTGSLKYLQS